MAMVIMMAKNKKLNLTKLGINEVDLQRRIEVFKEVELTKDNSYYIFPYSLSQGFVDLSQYGENVSRHTIKDATIFERVFTGNDNAIAEWDESTNLLGVDTNDRVKKDFKIGDYFFGITYSEEVTSETMSASIDEDFQSEKETKSYSMFIPFEQKGSKNNLFNDEYTKKLFKIPELTTKWLKMTNYQSMFDMEKNIIGYNATFETQAIVVGHTGRQVYSTIQQSAPGEGYAEPYINDNQDVILDPDKLTSKGVDEIQIELLGNAMYMGALIWGRDVSNDELHQPKPILHSTIQYPIPSALTKTGFPNSEIACVRSVQPTLISFYKDWKEDVKGNYDWSVRKKFEGIFQTNHTQTVNDTTHLHAPWDTLNLVKLSQNEEDITIAGTESKYTKGNIVFSKDGVKMNDIMSFQPLAVTNVLELPQQLEERIPFAIKDLPIIGGIFNMLGLGNFGASEPQTRYSQKVSPLVGFMSYQQYRFFTEAVFDINSGTSGSQNAGLVPYEAFDNDKGSPIGNITGAKSQHQAYRFKLTDKYVKLGTTYNTQEIGANGYPNGKVKVATNQDKSFILDKIIPLIPSKCEYIISFYKDGKLLQSSRYKTQAQWTDNTRNWMSVCSLSAWHKHTFNGSIDWQPIPELPYLDYGLYDLSFQNYETRYTGHFYLNNLSELFTQDQNGNYLLVDGNKGQKYEYISVKVPRAIYDSLNKLNIEDYDGKRELSLPTSSNTGKIYNVNLGLFLGGKTTIDISVSDEYATFKLEVAAYHYWNYRSKKVVDRVLFGPSRPFSLPYIYLTK